MRNERYLIASYLSRQMPCSTFHLDNALRVMHTRGHARPLRSWPSSQPHSGPSFPGKNKILLPQRCQVTCLTAVDLDHMGRFPAAQPVVQSRNIASPLNNGDIDAPKPFMSTGPPPALQG